MFWKLHVAERYGSALAGGLFIILLLSFISSLIIPNEEADQGQTTDLKIVEASVLTDVNGFTSGQTQFHIDTVMGYGEKTVADITGTTHENATFIINEFSEGSNNENPYILLEVSEFKGKLKQYDTFKTTLSINPSQKEYEGLNMEDILWGSNENDTIDYFQKVKSKMTFIFINQDDEILGKYRIDSKKPLPIEIALNSSKRLFIVVQSDNKDFFVGGIYSPTLVKN